MVILNFLLIVIGIVCFIAWVHGLVNWDGKCHGDCSSCPYVCTEDEKSRLHADTPIRNTVETKNPKNRIK